MCFSFGSINKGNVRIRVCVCASPARLQQEEQLDKSPEESPSLSMRSTEELHSLTDYRAPGLLAPSHSAQITLSASYKEQKSNVS